MHTFRGSVYYTCCLSLSHTYCTKVRYVALRATARCSARRIFEPLSSSGLDLDENRLPKSLKCRRCGPKSVGKLDLHTGLIDADEMGP